MYCADRGFTLLEALVVVVVLSLVLSLGMPAMRDFVATHRALAWQNRLHVALNLARHHAIYHTVPTVICATSGSSGCASSAADWGQGWLIFEDSAGLNDCRPDPEMRFCEEGGGRIIRVQDRARDLRIITNHNIARRVRFNALGMTYGYTGRFAFCPGVELKRPRGLVVPQTGRIRAARPREVLDCPRR